MDCGVVTVLTEFGCYVGLGPADGLGWWCGNHFCDPDRITQDAQCPRTVWGCYTGQDGVRRCIDRPNGLPQVSCSVSKTTVVVGERLLLSATSSSSSVPVQFVFDHDDGTLDPGSQSHAYYAAPGSDDVTVRWSTTGQSGVTGCGTVTVTWPPTW